MQAAHLRRRTSFLALWGEQVKLCAQIHLRPSQSLADPAERSRLREVPLFKIIRRLPPCAEQCG